MSTSPGRRLRAVLVTLAAVGLAAGAASPALADSGTPLTPTNLINDNQACVTDQSAAPYINAGSRLTIEAVPGDTDPAAVAENFQLWPVDDPTQVTSFSGLSVGLGTEGLLNVPGSDLLDGHTYAWQAQTAADGTTSAWSAPCYVTIDETSPSAAPTITSSNYPENVEDQGGAPIQFTFGANGVSDVIGYEFAWLEPPTGGAVGPISDPYDRPAGAVAASTLGGSATVDLVPPDPSFQEVLYVMSVDRAYNSSPVATYTLDLKQSSATVSLVGARPNYGKPTTFKLTPDPGIAAQSPVTGYEVQVAGDPNGQQNYTVPASPDGTALTQITFDNTFEWVEVSAVSADGWVSGPGSYYYNTAPAVSSNVYVENATSGGVGVTGTFTFAPTVNGVVSYSYSFDYGSTETTVAAHHGKANIRWTPSASGSYDIEVYATLADGTQLYPYDYSFNVS